MFLPETCETSNWKKQGKTSEKWVMCPQTASADSWLLSLTRYSHVWAYNTHIRTCAWASVLCLRCNSSLLELWRHMAHCGNVRKENNVRTEKVHIHTHTDDGTKLMKSKQRGVERQTKWHKRKRLRRDFTRWIVSRKDQSKGQEGKGKESGVNYSICKWPCLFCAHVCALLYLFWLANHFWDWKSTASINLILIIDAILPKRSLAWTVGIKWDI